MKPKTTKPLFEKIDLNKSDFYQDRKRKLNKLMLENLVNTFEINIKQAQYHWDIIHLFYKFKKSARKILKNL